MAQDPSVGREMLPIPDRVKPGLTVFDAKDPANSFPPIEPLRPPKGAHELRVEFDYDGGGVSKGGTATLFVDGDQVGQGRVEQTVGIMFASDETTDIGRDTATVVTDAYGPSGQNDFTGDISWIRLDVGDDAHDPDHYIDEGDRLTTILGRQ